jgi:hypothetical protein
VLGDDLDRAVVLDGRDAAAQDLAVEEVDEDVGARSATGLWLVHATKDAHHTGQV